MATAISLHILSELAPEQRAALFKRAESDIEPYLEKVRPIIDAVKSEGDSALARFANELDKSPVTPNSIAVQPAEFDEAFELVDAEMVKILEFCCDNVRRFHEAQMPERIWMKEMHPGVTAGEKVEPIESVACYVPRGKGSFPSVAMMTAIPAVVAGVQKVAIVTPPGPGGKIDAATLVAARLADVESVFKCGGAQAVAAVAYGTETVPRCRKIVGPGSPWVTSAKRLLADHVDPGIPAGPSESIVLCDDATNGRVAALDLLNESEHGPDSSAFLVTAARNVAEEAITAIPVYWKRMSTQRAEFSSTVLCSNRGGVVLADDMDAAVDFVNEFAPEHLQIHAVNPRDYLDRIRNAGEILLGEHTAICLGNFTLGPNAVLPTNAAARTRSPLSVHDFMKRISVGEVTEEGYGLLAPYAHRFALYEGFDAHANAVSDIRERARSGN